MDADGIPLNLSTHMAESAFFGPGGRRLRMHHHAPDWITLRSEEIADGWHGYSMSPRNAAFCDQFAGGVLLLLSAIFDCCCSPLIFGGVHGLFE